ncbi:MAG: hypothetical protein ACK5Y6_05520 [Pseudomonadota bacterium]|jgi:hypothetical protein
MATTKSKTKPKTTRKATTKQPAQQPTPTEPALTLDRAIQITLKSSTYPVALTEPKLVKLGELTFIEGTQVTGKVGHRLEGKRTLIATDNIATLICYASEDDIWSEPQSKLIRHAINEEDKNPVLTLHEQGQANPQRHGNNFNNGNSDRPRFDYHQRDQKHRGNKHRGKHRHHGRNRDDRDNSGM